MAAQDASGELRFLGRKSDVIVTPSGMNIHAADLEAAVNKQPGVGGCAIVPCSISQAQEPVAVVIFSGADEQLQAAVRAANQELAEYQQIRNWLRWPELNFPYTSTGKLLRRKIAEWACAALADREVSAQPAPDSDALLRLVADITGAPTSHATDSSLLSEDLRLDSLGRVQLQSALEQRLGIELPDHAMESVSTLGELRNLLHSPATGDARFETPAGFPPDTPRAFAPSGAPTPSQNDHLYPHWPWWTPMHLLRIFFYRGRHATPRVAARRTLRVVHQVRRLASNTN